MADPIRLYAEFKDDLGDDWRLNIHDANYGGSAIEFKLGADGFVFRYSGDNENRHQSIIGSEVTFTLTEENSAHETFMDLLATNNEARFSVSIRKDPDGTDEFWWGGILLPEQVVRPFNYFPIQNTLTASDDIGNLENILYNNDGAAYTGQGSVIDHALNCLNKIRTTHLWGTDDFLYYVNDFVSTQYTGANQLIDTRISHYGLYNEDSENQKQYYSTFEVLENLAKVFNARIFQAQGKWWFLPVGAQKYSTTLTVEGTQKDGTALAQQSIATAKNFDSDFERMNGYEYTYLAPLKTVSRTRKYNGNFPVVFDGLYTEQQFGTAISDTDIDYNTGTTLAVSGVFNYEYNGDNTSTGNARIGRIEMRFTIKVGTKYLQRDVTYDGLSAPIFYGFGDLDDGPYQYTTHVYGDVSLSNSLAYYYIVTPIFDKRDGESLSVPFYFDLPALATDENGLDITVQVFGRDYQGNNNTALVDNTNADFEIVTLRGDVTGPEPLGDTVDFTATNSQTARAHIDQGISLFGDYETPNADGVLRIIVGVNAVTSTQWQSLNYTGSALSLNRLGVQEILAGQVKPTRVQRGQVYGSLIYMWQVINDTAGDYALFQLTYTARSVETDLEAFQISRDLTNVISAQGDTHDVSTPIGESSVLRSAIAFDVTNRALGVGYEGIGNRNQTILRTISQRDTVTTQVNDTDLHIVNTWTGPNGYGTLELPAIAESHGRTIQIHSDSTISANTFVRLIPSSSDTGVTIDGGTSYSFNRAYDGITILGHTDGNWYIIQKKEK